MMWGYSSIIFLSFNFSPAEQSRRLSSLHTSLFYHDHSQAALHIPRALSNFYNLLLLLFLLLHPTYKSPPKLYYAVNKFTTISLILTSPSVTPLVLTSFNSISLQFKQPFKPNFSSCVFNTSKKSFEWNLYEQKSWDWVSLCHHLVVLIPIFLWFPCSHLWESVTITFFPSWISFPNLVAKEIAVASL